MPYGMREEGGRWCVYNKATGQTVKCHADKDAAQAHLAALIINVQEASLSWEVGRGFAVDLFAVVPGAVDGETVAARALAGEPIVVIPRGVFHRDGKARNIGDQEIAQFIDNWNHRMERGIRRSQLAVDTDHNGRAVGWYKSVEEMAEGVGSSFRWTSKGRQALEDAEFAYFSPTIYWRLVDRVTNEPVHNQLGGGALTNYPFFGEATALFSLAGLDYPVYYAVMKTEDGVQYPARAYLVVEDPAKVDTWHLRVMSWKGGKLVYDHNLMGAAKAALTSPGGHRGNPYKGPQKQEATRKLKALYKREGLEFILEGGTDMGDQDPKEGGGKVTLKSIRELFDDLLKLGEGDPPADNAEVTQQIAALTEQFATLKTEMEAVGKERDAAKAEVDELKGRLGQVEDERQVMQYQGMVAEKFSHLPQQDDDLAGHLRWLATVDQEEEQPHLAFFLKLLERADAEFARAFQEVGAARGRMDAAGGVMALINKAVEEHQKAHPEMDYTAALDAVLSTRKDLFELYEAERNQGGVQ